MEKLHQGKKLILLITIDTFESIQNCYREPYFIMITIVGFTVASIRR